MGRKNVNALKERKDFKEFVEREAKGAKVLFYGGTRAGNGLKQGIYILNQPDGYYKNRVLKIRLKSKDRTVKGSEEAGISYSKCKGVAYLIDALADFNRKQYGFEHIRNGRSTKNIIDILKKNSKELELGELVILEELFSGPGLYHFDIPYENCLTGIAVAYTMPIVNCNDSVCLPGVRFKAIGKGLNYLSSEYLKSLKSGSD